IAVERDFVGAGICGKSFVIGHNQRRDKISVISDHDDVYKIRDQLQPVFDGLWSHILSTRCDDNVLLSIRDLQEAIRIQFPDVAGMEPVSLEYVGGRAFHPIVAGHNVRTADEDFTVASNSDFLITDNPANSSKPHCTWCVERYHR